MSAQHKPADAALCPACRTHATECCTLIRTQGRPCCPECPGGDGKKVAS